MAESKSKTVCTESDAPRKSERKPDFSTHGSSTHDSSGRANKPNDHRITIPGYSDGFIVSTDPPSPRMECAGLSKRRRTGTKPKKPPLYVYTDGSCFGNGYEGAVGGIGVYFGLDDSRNVGQPVSGEPSNQRAELEAILVALSIVQRTEPSTRKVVIHTDSAYSIQCLTTWYKKWKINGWKTSGGKDVLHQDLIIPCLELLENLPNVSLKKVKGHSKDEGNDAADALARQGSRLFQKYIRIMKD